MNEIETQSNVPIALSNSLVKRQHRSGQYQRVFDERKRPIRGLWVRNGRYYAQLTVENPHTGAKSVKRVPLENATTPAQAKNKLEELRVGRRKGDLPVLKRPPKFSEFADHYLAFHKQAKDKKRSSTMKTEEYAINQWKTHLGDRRLDQIKRIHIDSFVAKRQSQGKAARTVNLEVTVFRNVMNKAIDQQLIIALPTENLRPLKGRPRKRDLISTEQIEKLCKVAFEPMFMESHLAQDGETGVPLNNAQQFSDYIKLMAYSGARMSEALRLQWTDVDWRNKQLRIGSDGEVKNYKPRSVDFNSQLEKHMQEMLSRKAPDSVWLFPSPRRGKSDLPAKTFRESMILARTASGMPGFGFHDCRHFFISMCVMAGIDYMTIARWVGHQDGGVLIGRVYGHLSNEHAQKQAQKLQLAV